MTYRFHRTNIKTGITYVYEAVSFWNKEKNQPRNKQVCIGKLDPNTGDLIPSKRFAFEQVAQRDLTVTASAAIVGPSIVLDTITQWLSLAKLLKSSFSQEYQQILTMAYYLAAQGDPPSHCQAWCNGHAHPCSELLSSQHISEILRAITINSNLSMKLHFSHSHKSCASAGNFISKLLNKFKVWD